MNKAVFLDLNGTLISSLALEEPFHFNLITGVEKAVAKLSESGFVCPVVTIQSRIAKGYFTESEFIQKFSVFSEKLKASKAYIEGPYLCPHDYDTACLCKKPQSYLFEKAAHNHNIRLKHSYVIGDSIRDAISAIKFGGRGCFIKSVHKTISDTERKQLNALKGKILVAESIQEAVDWILEIESNSEKINIH